MKALVVFESMWGNTERVARAIVAGLEESMEVMITDVSHAPADPGDDIDLIVAGGPTHAFSMSRRSTRADAHSQGAPYGDESVGLREWLDRLPSGRHTQLVATFDTRVDKVRHLPGSAAKSAAKTAHRHGYPKASHAESFYVHDTEGPLLDGEMARAAIWARELAEKVTAGSRTG
jgi:hypothetical protein